VGKKRRGRQFAHGIFFFRGVAEKGENEAEAIVGEENTEEKDISVSARKSFYLKAS